MASIKDTSPAKRAVKFEGPFKGPSKTALKTATSTISSSSADSPQADHSAHKSTESCKYGDNCHGCRVCKKGGKGGGAQVTQVAQLSSQVNDLRKELASMKAASAASDARLGKVEADVGETKTGIAAMLVMMQEDRDVREHRRLPAHPSRRAIMSATEVLTTSDSDEPDQFEYVPYGEGDEERFSVNPIWGGKKKKSTPVACKGGSAAASSSSSSSSERKDLSRAAGGGAMVIASKSKPQPLPLPETLGRSGKERSSSPKIERLHGTGLVLCTDLNSLVRSMEDDGYNEVPVIVKRTKEVSVHFKTAIINAHDLGDDEARMLAMLFADSGRSATRISDACKIRREVIDCFSKENLGMFMKFFARMAENYHSRPDKGVEISGCIYSYVVLGTDKKICTSFLKYLRDN